MATASSSQKWEVVKTGKPKKREALKKNLPMPTIEPAAPVKETPTIYSEAFGPKSSGTSSGALSSGSPKTASQKKPIQKKKLLPKETLKKHQTLGEALKSVNVNDLQDIFSKSRLLFPNNPEVWLLDISGALQSALEDVVLNDPTFAEHPKGYPLSIVPAALHKELSNFVKDCSQATLETFFIQCVQQVTTSVLKGNSAFGFIILIQLLSRQKGDAVQFTIPKLQELSRKYQNQKPVCLSILWCAAQIGSKSLDVSLKVWLSVMFPLVGLKAMTQYVTSNLNETLMKVPATKIAEDTVTPEQFLGLLELAHDPPSAIVNAKLAKQVLDDYHKVKLSLFGPKCSGQLLQLFFPHFLSRLSPNSSKGGNSKLSAELLSLLATCLRREPACVTKWRSIFFKNLAQTSLLVTYLFELRRGSADDRQLIQAVSSSLLTAVEHLDRPDDGRLIQLRKQLQTLEQTAAHAIPSRWPRYFLLFFFMLICTAFSVDVIRAGSLERSWSGQQLSRAGLMPHVRLLQQRIALQARTVGSWVRLNVPVYWGKLSATLQPILQSAWSQLLVFAAWIYEVSGPFRLAAIQYAAIAFEWLKLNGPVWLEFAKQHTMWLWTILLEWYTVVAAWLLQNVFVGNLSPANLHAMSSETLLVCREHLMTFYTWCSQLIN